MPFTTSVEKILLAVERGFEEKGDVLQLTGLPFRAFCFKHPDHVGEILRHQPVGITKHPGVLPRVKYVMGTGGYILEGGPAWKERRVEVQPAFKSDALAHYSQQVPALTDELFDLWDVPAEGRGRIDITTGLRALITRINFQIFFSTDLAGGGAGLQSSLLEAIEHQTHALNLDFVRALPLGVPTPRNIRFKRNYSALRKTMLNLVVVRRGQFSEKRDLLTVLLNATDQETGAAWSDDEVVGEIFSIYFGASVVSTTLAWCLHLVASHPQVQEQLIGELREQLQGREPTVEDLKNLPYTEAVLLETIRLFPPSWGYPRRCIEGMEVDGYRVSPDSLVIPMVYFTHRDPRFWRDPATFDPGRFQADKRAGMHRFAHYPYGIGPRKCLGANLAPLIILPIMVKIFQRYRLDFKPRFEGDPRPEFGFEIHPRDEIMMGLQRL